MIQKKPAEYPKELERILNMTTDQLIHETSILLERELNLKNFEMSFIYTVGFMVQELENRGIETYLDSNRNPKFRNKEA